MKEKVRGKTHFSTNLSKKMVSELKVLAIKKHTHVNTLIEEAIKKQYKIG